MGSSATTSDEWAGVVRRIPVMKKTWLASTPLRPSGSAVFKSPRVKRTLPPRERARKNRGVATRIRIMATASGSIDSTAIFAKE